jgi:hypothetical protein
MTHLRIAARTIIASCLLGRCVAFPHADHHLEVTVSDTTVREICQAEGAKMTAWPRTSSEVRGECETAAGDVEFTTDGTMVNTTDGWQERKPALFAKRPRGDSAPPIEWDRRRLPKPAARVAFAAREAGERFGTRRDQWAGRSGVKDDSTITVPADGAKWIWEEARQNLAGSAGVPDICHALEHVGTAANSLFGEGADATRDGTDAARTALLERGWTGIDEHVRHTTAPDASAARKALDSLRDDLGNHVSHPHYASRKAARSAVAGSKGPANTRSAAA